MPESVLSCTQDQVTPALRQQPGVWPTGEVAPMDERTIARFWARVEYEPNSGCWLWPGARSSSGYGNISAGGEWWRSHRLAYTLAHGAIPDGAWVLHRCDNKLCVNPDHLYAGTHRDNVTDAVSRKRYRRGNDHGLRRHPERAARGSRHGSRTHPHRVMRGERHTSAKLSSADVREIRRRRASGERLRSIADDYGLCDSTVCQISKGLRWKHV